MKIDFIKLKNYRPYLDETIYFSDDEKTQNFTIIQGPNGAGKSSLLNSITWCLYGKEINLKETQKGLPVFNTQAFDNLDINKIIEARVEVHLLDKEGLKHNFIRSIRYRKSNNGEEQIIPNPSSGEKDGSSFEYWKQESKSSHAKKITGDIKFYLEELLPENINEYFFFDGEKLDEYFKKSSGQKIKEAVFDISQINIIEKTINRLKNKKKELVHNTGDLGPEIEKLKEEINSYQKGLDEFKEDIRQKKYQKKKTIDIINELSKELKQYPESANYEEKRIELQNRIEEIEKDIIYFNDEKLKKLLRSSRVIISLDSLKKTKELIDKAIDDGRYPPDLRKDYIESLLKGPNCICGRSLDKKCKDNIELLLDRVSKSTEISNEITRMQGILRSMIEGIENFDEEQTILSQKIKGLEKQSSDLSKNLELVSKKIGSSPIKKIKSLNKRLEEAQLIKDDLIDQIARKESQVPIREREIDDKNKDLTNSISKQGKFKKIRMKLEFLDRSIEFAENIRDEIMQEVRAKIEEKTKDQFFNLIWNPDSFKNIVIDEDYNISVIHHSGREGIGTLSSGQRQVLALSFIAALKNVSGFDMPLVIDTPLGRISKEPKKNIAKKLPNYLKGTQVTLLVTEEEYTPEVRELVKKRVKKEYRIILKNPECAEVVDYGK